MKDPGWALPCRVEDLADDPDFRRRAAGITGRSVSAITEAVGELASLGLVPDASAEVRLHSLTPLFKLYVINDDDAFFGFYPVTEHLVTIKGNPHNMYDLLGKDATLFHHSASSGDETSGQYVQQARVWFDSVWGTVAHEPTDEWPW